MLMAAPIAFAEGQKISAEVLGGAEAASPVNWNSEKLVWKTGTIDTITPDGVVIGDVGYQWSKFGTRFRGSDGKILNSGNFNQGSEVIFVLESDRKTIVTLIKGEFHEETKE